MVATSGVRPDETGPCGAIDGRPLSSTPAVPSAGRRAVCGPKSTLTQFFDESCELQRCMGSQLAVKRQANTGSGAATLDSVRSASDSGAIGANDELCFDIH